MSADREMVADWIHKAENDRKAALALLSLEGTPSDSICFHAQQTVEKALKALLIYRSVKFQRTHDLDILLDVLDDSDFEPYRASTPVLTSYAVDARYPGDYVEPEREEAAEAVQIAGEIYDLVKSKIGL
ncbi:MAG: HEPN domain-containing protein [Deltaproteobacteria bacterium]|nr:HEPN domain-containing protein [Deltaproteobacteria bacterium]